MGTKARKHTLLDENAGLAIDNFVTSTHHIRRRNKIEEGKSRDTNEKNKKEDGKGEKEKKERDGEKNKEKKEDGKGDKEKKERDGEKNKGYVRSEDKGRTRKLAW